jgi:hypothetical protein
VATATVTPAVSHPQLTVITSEEISRYAEITAQLSQLEALQKALRIELLDLHRSAPSRKPARLTCWRLWTRYGALLIGRITPWLWPKSCTASSSPRNGG